MALATFIFMANFIGFVIGIQDRDKWMTGLGLIGSLCGVLLIAGELAK